MDERPLSIWDNGPPAPCPSRFNMAAYALKASALYFPNKVALRIVNGGEGKASESYTFGEIDQAVRRAAGAMLKAGIQRGDRVLIKIGDGPLFPIAYFGALATGAIAMPLSAQLSAKELQEIIRQTEPKLALIDEQREQEALSQIQYSATTLLDASALREGPIAEYEQTSAEDPALLIFTSGSSGKPKGVLHAQRALWARRMMHQGWHCIRESDIVIHAGAFNWTYTLGVGLTDPWSVGAAAIINTGSKSPEIWPTLARHWQPTIFAAVPGVFRRILKYGEGLEEAFQSLRHAVSAGESLHADLLNEWRRRTNKPLHEALGMSECSTFISSCQTREATTGTAGWPQPGRYVALLDAKTHAPVLKGEEGELTVHRSDPGLMLGYWRDKGATEAAMRGDWFLTGDLARMSEDGALIYLGRNDDQMNAQGYRVAPLEVEAALAKHPAISECAVAELTISEGLSVIAAWIVLRDTTAKAALEEHLSTHLAAYKCPRAYFTVPALPKSTNGKMQRRNLSSLNAIELL